MVNRENQTSYSFRQATDADYDFLYKLHVLALRPYVELLWGWEETWQQEYFKRKFNPLTRKIIQIEGWDAGVLVVQHHPQQIYIALIEVMPEFQGRGVGTAILTELCSQARACNKAVTLHVLKSNHPARRLYEKSGFVIASEEEHRIKMIKRFQKYQLGVSRDIQDNH